jgi:hypothetical protein
MVQSALTPGIKFAARCSAGFDSGRSRDHSWNVLNYGLSTPRQCASVTLFRSPQMTEKSHVGQSRRDLLLGGAGVVAATALSAPAAGAAPEPRAARGQPSGVTVQKIDTAIVFIDPQNDVLSERGTSWGAVSASVIENKTRENMERIFKSAKANGSDVFISPHYFYPTGNGWKFNGPLETEEFRTHTFARSGPLTLAGFANSGADWLDRFKPYINDGKTVVVSPHQSVGAADQRFGPSTA